MHVNRYLLGRAGFAAACAALLSACAPAHYIVKTPEPSGQRYETSVQAAPPKTELALADQRPPSDRVFSAGTLPAGLNTASGAIDPPAYLATALQQELASRGLPVTVAAGATGQPRLELRTFKIQNHRSNGFAPFVTLTYLSADLDTPAGRKRVAAFVKRGKVPVMSFDEVIEPTLNQPLSIAVKEIASKVANELYGYRASDAKVDALIARIGAKRDADTWLDVYALGFANNPRSVDTLVRLVSDADENVRLAAISSLGTLRANAQLEMLKSLSQNKTAVWADRGMALKSIGDLGSDEARAFLAAEAKRWEGQGSGKEAAWNLQIIGLYR
ncbi:HEAT repeat domain-containing protein [Rivibacter subsaxonicus]|uniref:HEAT repeat protein n=1 Tax=Rivibacter subsaxonicus TaxID=457575 RepID=A0A4Q7W0M4_9BURK|nr:HEAT repeat domain-containing protein [Rivibacter subsaxonicus]RZU02774.1 HEAT repeat protein [Rivibacter subsaxonicus]